MDSVSMTSERFEDRGIGPGGSDYLGYDFRVRVGNRTYAGRNYADDPGTISFVSAEAPLTE